MRAERCTLVFELRNHPRYTQIKINTRFCRNLCFISLPFEIFTTFTRSFLCILHAERTARVFHRRYRLRHTQITIIYPFCPKLTVISHRLRYLNVYMLDSLHFPCSTYCTRFPPSIQAQKLANCNDSTILSKIKLYFHPVCDISTFKRSFHSILYAERIARAFQRRHKPRHTHIAAIRRFCRK